MYDISWIQSVGPEWGRFEGNPKRSGWSSTSTLGRVIELGPQGATIRQFKQVIPCDDTPEEVLIFRRAWKELAERHRRVIYVVYAVRGVKWQRKADLMQTTSSTFYRWRESAHDAMLNNLMNLGDTGSYCNGNNYGILAQA